MARGRKRKIQEFRPQPWISYSSSEDGDGDQERQVPHHGEGMNGLHIYYISLYFIYISYFKVKKN